MSLLSLPDEIIRVIAFQLNPRDALVLSNTCTSLRSRMDQEGFWTAYLKHRRDREETGIYADPSVFPYESLPRKLDRTGRELVLLQSKRMCAGLKGTGCTVYHNMPASGQRMCQMASAAQSAMTVSPTSTIIPILAGSMLHGPAALGQTGIAHS